jgi:hypothetical protein
MSYLEINSNTEEGFQDLVFNIEKYWNDEYGNHIVHARGNFQGSIVGFELAFRPDMKPGVVKDEFDNAAFYAEGINLYSIGRESDELIRALSKLYSVKYKDQKMIDKVKLTSFALDGNPHNFGNEELKFKVFHDDTNSSGLYAEMYINISVEQCLVEIKEKDIEYRKNIFGALIGEEPNILVKLMKKAFKRV